MPAPSKLRVVVCGSVFGQIYMEALAHADCHVTLAGIVSRGSPRSLACADRLGVPHFSSVSDIPDDVDAACIVVRGALLGGQGSAMARACLQRGLHVLQEHPIHRDELIETLRVAHSARRCFMLNCFYPHFPETRKTLQAVRRISQFRTLQWINAKSSFQVSFAMLDVIGEAANGLANWTLEPASTPPRTGSPWKSVTGEISGVPTSLDIQMEMDPADPDNHNILLHRLNFGFSGGTLTQTDVHGPLIWTAQPEFPDVTRAETSRPYFSAGRDGAPASMCLSEGSTRPYSELFQTSWASAVRRAIGQLAEMTENPEHQRAHAQRMLAVCRCWMDLSAILGSPGPVTRPSAPPLSREELADIVAGLNWEETGDG
ncbi:MAG: Gfo/Idh/MocA family oxidoreductase [Paracoccaceae bacterium]|nr:Gfo/Idh/MocA family oxidoreductase [Paracoccaceae bacterium]